MVSNENKCALLSDTLMTSNLFMSSADNIRRYQWATEKPDNHYGKNCAVQKETDGAISQNLTGNTDIQSNSFWCAGWCQKSNWKGMESPVWPLQLCAQLVLKMKFWFHLKVFIELKCKAVRESFKRVSLCFGDFLTYPEDVGLPWRLRAAEWMTEKILRNSFQRKGKKRFDWAGGEREEQSLL